MLFFIEILSFSQVTETIGFFFPYKSSYFECYATMVMLADAHISSLGYLWWNTPAIGILHTMANSFSRDLLYDHNHAGSSLLHDQTAVVGTCCSNAQWQNHVAISVTCHENNFALKFVHNALKRKREHKEALWTIYMENRVIPGQGRIQMKRFIR